MRWSILLTLPVLCGVACNSCYDMDRSADWSPIGVVIGGYEYSVQIPPNAYSRDSTECSTMVNEGGLFGCPVGANDRLIAARSSISINWSIPGESPSLVLYKSPSPPVAEFPFSRQTTRSLVRYRDSGRRSVLSEEPRVVEGVVFLGSGPLEFRCISLDQCLAVVSTIH